MSQVSMLGDYDEANHFDVEANHVRAVPLREPPPSSPGAVVEGKVYDAWYPQEEQWYPSEVVMVTTCGTVVIM